MPASRFPYFTSDMPTVTPSESDDLLPLTPEDSTPVRVLRPVPAAASSVGPLPHRAPRPDNLLRALIGAGVIGIWALVFQNMGAVQDVSVVNTVDVEGRVGVQGTVDVGNTVDMNISQINGLSDVFYNYPSRDPAGKYFRIPVATP